MTFEYNHDLNVSNEFLDNYNPIRDALKDSRLLKRVRLL